MAITRHAVQDISPNKLRPYEHNSKLHPEEQIEQIKKSIMEFGFLDPIAYDENFEILEGHGRLLAAQRLELKTVPAFQVTGLTEAEKRAYRIAHNKLTMNTDFDPDLLKIDFEFLSDLDFDLELTGFDAPDLTFYTDEDGTEYQDREVVGHTTETTNARQLGNSERHSADNQDLTKDDVPVSSVRMAQLFLNTETHPLFLEMIDRLNDIYGTENPTDCVMAGLKELCKNHSIEIQIT